MSVWLKSMIGYLLIASIVMQMMPDKKYEDYIKLFTGFLFWVMVLQPIFKIGSVDTFLENKILEFVQEQEELDVQIGIQSEKFQQKSEEMQIEDQEKRNIKEIEKVHVEVSTDD